MNIRFYNAKILLPGTGHTFQLIEGELWGKREPYRLYRRWNGYITYL